MAVSATSSATCSAAARGGGRGGRRATGPQRGHDLETELHLSFADAVHGVTSTVRFRADAVCETCHGNGARPGTPPRDVPAVRGQRLDRGRPGPVLVLAGRARNCGGRGQVITDPCPTCHGRGVEVRAREVKVRIPAGVDDGQRIRVKGRGAARARTAGRRATCYVVVSRAPARGCSVATAATSRCALPLTFAEAALGAEVKVPTLDEPVTVRIPPGTPTGKVLRVRGRGVPSSNGAAAGDLLVTVDVQVPTELTDAQRAAVEALAQAFPDDPRAGLIARSTRSTPA